MHLCMYLHICIQVFVYTGVSKNRVPQNGWFILENPNKMDNLGGTTIFGNIHTYMRFLCVCVGSALRIVIKCPHRERLGW